MLLLFSSIALIALFWKNYGNRILSKIGICNYTLSAHDERIIRGWTKSLIGFETDIVFFGDSLTCHGNWNGYFPSKNICMLSIPGARISSSIYRTKMVLQLNPKKIFVMLGINDLSSCNWKEIITTEYTKIISQFKETGAQVYIQSILPVRPPSRINNNTIDRANELLKNIANTYSCTYIDLHTEFSDENNQLIKTHTKDGLHLKESGYDLWVSIIKNYVE